MSYHVLARHFRPKTFQEMVGQTTTLRMLTNALDQKRLHHAYLFTGTRGVGKTTLARLFAKCLLCETDITSMPCGQCAMCTAIDAGKCLDLLEIDAASRTKVEDTRDLLDNIHYPPLQGRFKIYLIDEVHMLSGHSFNALLKTLEEPPPHVKFLLATTDPKKIPITVLSRCLPFHLKRIPESLIANHLKTICDKETVTADAEALAFLARAADGSLRDALSLLDQAIAYCGNDITKEAMVQLLGCLPQDRLFAILTALSEQNGLQLLQHLTDIAEEAPDYDQLLTSFLSLLHEISRRQVVSESCAASEKIVEFAKRFSPEQIQLYYQMVLMGRRDLPFVSSPAQGFEMVMMRLLAFTPVPIPAESIIPTIPPETHATSNCSNTASAMAIQSPSVSKKSPVIASQDIAPSQWATILSQLQLTGMAQALASNCTLEQWTETTVTLALAKQHEPMLHQKLKERLQEALSRYANQTLRLEVMVVPETEKTPAKERQEEKDKRKAAAIEHLQQDATVQNMIQLFDATLDVNSIRAIESES